MLLTEVEAKKRWCPMARAVSWEHGDAVTGNRVTCNLTTDPEGSELTAASRCVASDCAMWRWRMEAILGDAGAHRGWRQTDKGYCGLAGMPTA